MERRLEEGIFAAEFIRKQRVRKGKLQYLIRWRGYGSRYDSWEPEENILDQRLLEEFHRSGRSQLTSAKRPTSKRVAKSKNEKASRGAEEISSKSRKSARAARQLIETQAILNQVSSDESDADLVFVPQVRKAKLCLQAGEAKEEVVVKEEEQQQQHAEEAKGSSVDLEHKLTVDVVCMAQASARSSPPPPLLSPQKKRSHDENGVCDKPVFEPETYQPKTHLKTVTEQLKYYQSWTIAEVDLANEKVIFVEHL